MKCLFQLEIIRATIGSCFGRYDSWAYRVHRLVCAYLQLTFQPLPFHFSPSHQCNISAKCCRDPAVTAFTTRMSTRQEDSGWSKPFLRIFVSGLLKYGLRYLFYPLDDISSHIYTVRVTMLRSTLVIKYYNITQKTCVQNYILQTSH